jgi:hypothetical protein
MSLYSEHFVLPALFLLRSPFDFNSEFKCWYYSLFKNTFNNNAKAIAPLTLERYLDVTGFHFGMYKFLCIMIIEKTYRKIH